MAISGIRLLEALQIDEHGSERSQIFEPTARFGDSAARRKHRIEVDATCLIDCQRMTLDLLARPPPQSGSCKVGASIGEAMHRGRDLGANQRCAKRVVDACELRRDRIHAIQCVQITEKLRRDTLALDDRFDRTRKARVPGETCPCPPTRTLQVDRRDLAVGRRWTCTVRVHNRGRVAIPTRGLRLSRRLLRIPHPVTANSSRPPIARENNATLPVTARCTPVTRRAAKPNGIASTPDSSAIPIIEPSPNTAM